MHHRGIVHANALFLICPASWGFQETLTTLRVQVPDRQDMRYQVIAISSSYRPSCAILTFDSQKPLEKAFHVWLLLNRSPPLAGREDPRDGHLGRLRTKSGFEQDTQPWLSM